MNRRWKLLSAVIAFATAACATAPKPTAASRRIAKYPPAIVEGRVTDSSGRPVAGIGVTGIPRGEDIPWSTPVATGCDGRFRLALAAPAAYGFLLSWKGTAVVTPEPGDPALVAVSVAPGAMIEGVALVFDAPAWRAATAAAPADAPACP